MAWTSPRTWLVGEIANASTMNTHVRDNLNHLFGALMFDEIKGSAGSWDTGAGGVYGGYKHLLGYVYATTGGGPALEQFYLRFNNDTGANYDSQFLFGTSTALASQGIGETVIRLGQHGVGGQSEVWFYVPNYTATTADKVLTSTFSSKKGTTNGDLTEGMSAGFWRSSAAITRISVSGSSANPGAGSRFTLYGLT